MFVINVKGFAYWRFTFFRRHDWPYRSRNRRVRRSERGARCNRGWLGRNACWPSIQRSSCRNIWEKGIWNICQNRNRWLLDLWRTFEVKKKTIDPEKTDNITMTFPVTLLDLYKEENKIGVDKSINSSRFASKIELKKNKLTFCHDVMKDLFKRSITSTMVCIHDILREKCVRNIRAILIVGGYSESPVLKAAVKREFHHLTVINPPQASSAILRGAVMFGHNPLTVTQRILKKTYGFRLMRPFKEGVHPEKRRRIIEGRIRCADCFSKLVTKGEAVKVGEIKQDKHPRHPGRSDNDIINFHIYASDLKKPVFVDEGCTYLGQLNVDISSLPKDMDRAEKLVALQLTFGDTEIKASATVVKTGENFESSFNFLGWRSHSINFVMLVQCICAYFFSFSLNAACWNGYWHNVTLTIF